MPLELELELGYYSTGFGEVGLGLEPEALEFEQTALQLRLEVEQVALLVEKGAPEIEWIALA